jgi:hypothetical protein
VKSNYGEFATVGNLDTGTVESLPRQYRRLGTKCTAEGCSNKPKAHDLCVNHYEKLRRSPDFKPRQLKVYGKCHCGKPERDLGMCNAHYMQDYRARRGTTPRQPKVKKQELPIREYAVWLREQGYFEQA